MDRQEDYHTTDRLLVLSGLCVLAVICNVLAPGMFWHAHGDSTKFLMFGAVGALVAEVCLLGIWCGLSDQPIKDRLPVTAALLLVGVCAYILGLQLPDLGRRSGGIPMEAALLIGGAGFAMFALMQVPLWLIRRSTRRRISTTQSAPSGESLTGSQFSVSYLMLWTAVVGVLLLLVRSTLPQDSDDVPLRELVEIMFVGLLYIGFSALLCIPCVWIVLHERPQLGGVLLLAGTLVAGPFVVLACTLMILGTQDIGDILAGVTGYEVGLSGTMLAVLLVFRSLGYRLLVAE